MATAITPAVIAAMQGQTLSNDNRDYYFLSSTDISTLQAAINSAKSQFDVIQEIVPFGYQQSFASAFDAWKEVANLGPDAVPRTSVVEAGILVAGVQGTFTRNGEALDGLVLTLPDGRKVVLFNVAGSDTYYTAGATGYSTLLHEIGHTLGLRHSFAEAGKPGVPTGTDTEQFTVMSYTPYRHTPVTPQLYDIGIVQQSVADGMYGPNAATRASDDSAYRFLATVGNPVTNTANGQDIRPYSLGGLPPRTPMVAIWDANGVGTPLTPLHFPLQ